MVRRERLVLLAVLGGLLFAASASGQSADQKQASIDPYWLGPFFAGFRVSEEQTDPVVEVVYGDCMSVGESGCAWPARVATSTTCALNPLSDETYYAPASLLRGGGLLTQNGGMVYVGTGYRTFTVETGEPELMSAALREARRRSQPEPEPLPPPVYPTAVLRELKRVTVAAERLRGVRAIGEETELGPEQVRYRLRVAQLLGPDALAGVRAPTMSTSRVKRLVKLADAAPAHPARTARENGMTVAELRKLVRRVRGLTGFC